MNPRPPRRPCGADLLTATLERLGADHVFGLPGTQNLRLFEALRRSRLRTVVASHELAASFMAIGYARASGRPGILVTIPGPGFTYALTGLAEAWLDSVPLVHVVGYPATGPGRRFQLQALDQAAMAGPVVKAVVSAARAQDIPEALIRAYRCAAAGEPGPVLLEVATAALTGPAEALSVDALPEPSPEPPPPAGLAQLLGLVAAASRILIYAGQGAAGDPQALLQLAGALGATVVTTTSARGVVPEDHPQLFVCDGASACLNQLAVQADLVLALGVKFSHNGAHGFRLTLARERLVHVDASPDSLDGHYPARLALACDVPTLVRALLAACPGPHRPPGWSAQELAAIRAQNARRKPLEPAIPGCDPPTPAGFFAALRAALPRDAILVTDSGQHQSLARRYYPVLAPQGLIVPTNLQSMGFALPAAIGAKLAQPGRPVVALLGDGGLAMSGMELLSAANERIALPVIVFVDGHYGQVRLQQLGEHGRTHGTEVPGPDYARLAAAFGIGHQRLQPGLDLAALLQAAGPTLLEVPLRDSRSIRAYRLKAMARATLGDLAGDTFRP